MIYESFPAAIMAQEMWLQLWVGWLVLINVGGGLYFLRRVEAKWVLLAMLGNGIMMNWLFMEYGYQRILGLAHIAFWTPLLVYLWRRRDRWEMSQLSGKWLAVLFTTNAISLLIDYVDVGRYLAGGRI